MKIERGETGEKGSGSDELRSVWSEWIAMRIVQGMISGALLSTLAIDESLTHVG